MKQETTELQIGQKWLLIAGVVVVLFGIGYFLKYAFDQNWVGPWGRVAMAYGGAFLFLHRQNYRLSLLAWAASRFRIDRRRRTARYFGSTLVFGERSGVTCIFGGVPPCG